MFGFAFVWGGEKACKSLTFEENKKTASASLLAGIDSGSVDINPLNLVHLSMLDSTTVSIFVIILVEWTNTEYLSIQPI